MYGILAAVENRDNAYFSHNFLNGLFKISKKTKEISYVASFDWESYDATRLYERAVYVNGSIIFFPNNAKKIAIYDINRNRLKPFEDDYYGNLLSSFNCRSLLAYKNDVWAFGNNGSDKIFKLHIIGGQIRDVKEDNDLGSIFHREGIAFNDYMGIKCICCDGMMLYTAGVGNKILVYDINSVKYSIHIIDKGVLSSLIGIDYRGLIWFILRGNDGVGCIDRESGYITMYEYHPDIFSCPIRKQPFMSMHFVDNTIVFIPARASSIVALNTNSGFFYKLADVIDVIMDFDNKTEIFPFAFSYETDMCIVALLNGRDGAVIVNKNDLSVHRIYSLPGEDIAYAMNLKEKLKIRQIIREKRENTFKLFLRSFI